MSAATLTAAFKVGTFWGRIGYDMEQRCPPAVVPPPRWLRRIVFVACGLLWAEHLAILTIPYRQSPTLFVRGSYWVLWGMLFIPCIFATFGLLVTRARRNAAHTVAALIILHVCCLESTTRKALEPVPELPWAYYSPEFAQSEDDVPPPRQIPYQYDVTFGILGYAIVFTGFWAGTILFCFLGTDIWKGLLAIDSYLARDFREAPPTRPD